MNEQRLNKSEFMEEMYSRNITTLIRENIRLQAELYELNQQLQQLQRKEGEDDDT